MKKKFDLEAGTTDFYVDATYYDHEFKQRTDDARWYARRYLESDGPVLELAVGTGRIALKAVRQGATVVGLDLSDTMLVKAAQRRAALPPAKAKNFHLARSDMRHFELDAQFDLITCPFNAFQHLYTRRDVERCLDSVRRHLRPDGRFILDVLMADFEYLLRSPYKRVPGVQFMHPTLRTEYMYSEQSAYDPITQINQMHFHYDRSSSKGQGPDRFSIQLSHRYFYPQELRALLHYNGFDILEEYGDFDDGPLDSDSDSMICVCVLS